MTKLSEKLAKEIGLVLKQLDLKIAIAESCTSGGLCFAITQVDGSSAWFERGFITYSNESKVDMLGVSSNTLATVGAVSQETAAQMAEGVLRKSQADISIAITGIAGPSGGSKEKPVGTVWIAYAATKAPLQTYLKIFSGTRTEIRESAIHFALEHLLNYIKQF